MKDYPKALFKKEPTRWSLLNFNILEEMAELMTSGSAKHTNYEDGTVDREEYKDKILRHYSQYLRGEVDKESGKNPLVHLLCDAMILLAAEYKEEEDEDDSIELVKRCFEIDTFCSGCINSRGGACAVHHVKTRNVNSCSGFIGERS